MKWLVLGCLLIGLTSAASAEPSDKLKQAVRVLEAGRCQDVLGLVNAGLADGDRDIYFLAGFMFSRGLCVKPDGARAARLLEASAKAAQGDAAMELVLMHGMGRGVPQSYAQAGVWARAASDIGELNVCDPNDSAAAASNACGKTLDVDYAIALGRVATIHALATDEVRARRREFIRQIQGGEVRLRVTVSTPALALRFEGGMGDEPLKDVSRRFVRESGKIVELLKVAYEKAVADAPAAPPCSQAACTFHSARTYGFRLE